MTFFKPTRWKILLCVILFLIWFIFVAQFTSYFGCSLVKLTYPNLPGQTAVESNTILTIIEFIILVFGYPLTICSRLDFNQTVGNIATILSFVFDFFFIYLISCILIFFIKKLKKKQKNSK
jgi:hypothetical protein